MVLLSLEMSIGKFSSEKTGGLSEPAALRNLYPLGIGSITGLGRIFAT